MDAGGKLAIYRYDSRAGHMIALEILEPIAGPAILLVHGQPGSGLMWGVLPRLLSRIATVYSYDRPGWGTSESDATDLLGNVGYLSSVVSLFGEPAPLLLGYSYGGALVLDFAKSTKMQNLKIVLVAPAANVLAFGRFDRMLEVDLISSLLATPPSFLRSRSKGVNAVTRLRNLRSLLAEARRLRGDLEQVGIAVRDDQEIVIVAGMLDRVVPPSSIRVLSKHLPQAKVVWLYQIGHTIVWRAPQVITGQVAELLGLDFNSANP